MVRDAHDEVLFKSEDDFNLIKLIGTQVAQALIERDGRTILAELRSNNGLNGGCNLRFRRIARRAWPSGTPPVPQRRIRNRRVLLWVTV